MIKPEDFYSKDEYPDYNVKKHLWKKVKNSIPKSKKSFLFNFDSRSFAFGFGAAFTAIFVCVGVFTLFSKIVEKDEPAYVKINNAYSKAIDEVEKSIPHLTTASVKAYSFDDLLTAGKTKLKKH